MPMRPKYICPFERLCMFLSIGFLPPTVPFNVVQQTHGILALFHFPMVGAGRGFLLRLASKPWLYLYIRLLLHLFLCQGWNFMKTFALLYQQLLEIYFHFCGIISYGCDNSSFPSSNVLRVRTFVGTPVLVNLIPVLFIC